MNRADQEAFNWRIELWPIQSGVPPKAKSSCAWISHEHRWLYDVCPRSPQRWVDCVELALFVQPTGINRFSKNLTTPTSCTSYRSTALRLLVSQVSPCSSESASILLGVRRPSLEQRSLFCTHKAGGPSLRSVARFHWHR